MMTSRLLSALSAAIFGFILLPANAAPIADGSLVFTDGAPTLPGNTYSLATGYYSGGTFIPNAAAYNVSYGNNTAGFPAEFRLIAPDGNVGGIGEKSLVGITDYGIIGDNGLQTISWGTSSGLVISADGDITPGASNSALSATQGLFTNVFLKAEWGFVFDPLTPISVDVDFGTSTLTVTTGSIETQWGTQFFPLGESGGGANECNTDGQGCGITLSGAISNIGPDGSFDFTLFGEHRITPYESTEGGTVGSAGFEGWVAQFALQGSFAPVPIPAAVWLFGSGLIGLVSMARRKKT